MVKKINQISETIYIIYIYILPPNLNYRGTTIQNYTEFET